MNRSEHNMAPKFASEEEAAKFFLTHDTSEFGDWSKAAQPNKGRSHFIPVPVPDDEYEQLDRIAREEKKTLAELVRQIFQTGLNTFTAHRVH